MPGWLAVIILGIIEGVTEFLSVSSTGHLLLVENNGWPPHQSDLYKAGVRLIDLHRTSRLGENIQRSLSCYLPIAVNEMPVARIAAGDAGPLLRGCFR